MSKKKWWIFTEFRRGRYRWRVPYPITKCAIVSTTDYATSDAARRAAWRAIKRLFPGAKSE